MERMDPITLIVAALAAGASAGTLDALRDDAKDAVKAAYAKLRGLVRKRVADQSGADLVLARHEADPQTWEIPLTTMLTDAGAADDAALVETARALMELADAAGTAAGKYNVTIKHSQGVQLGDHNIQVNRFGA
jgi:RIP homotypic interaction motif